jgi:alanine racemase
MTHFACADDRHNAMTAAQRQHFVRAVDGLAGARSMANSAAILGWPETHADWIRPGIMLYGASPFVDGEAGVDDLHPVMTLRARLIAVNHCRRGDTVGYGAAWQCPENMPVGVAAVGYGDGYPRHAASGTPVLVGGRRCALAGRVSMDMICIDLRACPEAAVGDEVTLWGEGLPVEQVARHSGTIAYDLLCGVTQRVEFSES